MTRFNNTTAAAVVAAVAAPFAIAGAASAATPAVPTTEPSITVFDQAAKDGKVSISYAYMPKDGYLVVYGTTADGKRSAEPLGVASLKTGDHRDVSVKLDKMPAAGSKLWGSIYKDTDGAPGLLKGADKPVWSDAQLPMENAFTVR